MLTLTEKLDSELFVIDSDTDEDDSLDFVALCEEDDSELFVTLTEIELEDSEDFVTDTDTDRELEDFVCDPLKLKELLVTETLYELLL